MKTSVIILQLVFLLFGSAASAQSQKTLDGFLDIAWGTPAAEAKQRMLARPGVTFKREAPSVLIFSGGSFAGRPANTFGLHLSGGKLYRGEAFLNSAGNRDAVYQ